MGDHNEVPPLIVQQQHQQQQQQLDWDNNPQLQQLSVNRAPYQQGTSQQQQQSQQQSKLQNNNNSSSANTPRRTRHRVDAGEPRGCFNNTLQNQIAGGYFPRNQFFHVNSRNYNNFHHHHHHHQQQPQQQHHNYFGGTTTSLGGPHPGPPQPPQIPPPPPQGQQQQDNYYFQPMKMLSEFISSANAVAAAQAAQQGKNQFLREMLCNKEASSTPTGNSSPQQGTSQLKLNNNNEETSTKPSKLDGMIGLMMEKMNNNSSPHHSSSSLSHSPPEVTTSKVEAQEQQDRQSDTTTPPPEMDGNKSNAADLLNNNTTTQVIPNNNNNNAPTTTTTTTTTNTSTRNKRKKYQPVKSDLVDDVESEEVMMNGDDEMIEEELLDDNESCKRVTRSQVKKEEEDDDDDDEGKAPEAHDFSDDEMSTRKRKLEFLDDDMDEDDAMLLRPITSGSRSSAATTNPDDMESIQEFENEEDEQEAMINDDLDRHGGNKDKDQGSRRTLPVVRNLMRMPIQQKHSSKEAPLTRQLLTSERPTSTPSSSSTLLEKPLAQQPPLSLLRRNLPPLPSSSPNSDLPNGLPPPPHGNFLQQWKENLKTTLMSHINELVDAQFSLLLGGNMLPPSALLTQERRQLRENNNRIEKVEQKRITPPPPPPQTQQPREQQIVPQHHHQQHHQQRSSTPRDSTPKPLMHLNGGSVMNNDKMLMSPPMEKKLPVARSTPQQPQDFTPGRFPFMQNMQNGQGGGKPHFSTALVGLTQHHLQQQAMAAAVAAGAVSGIENFLENDSPLSLVVNRASQEMGNVTPPKRKRHKVTDTRLTPRAVSRLLGQVDSQTNQPSSSPIYDHSGSSPAASPNNLQMEPRSILQNGTTPPPRTTDNHPPRERTPQDNNPQQQQQQQRPPFNPFQPPSGAPFFHPAAALAAAAAAGHPLHPHHRLDSPPMAASLLHPALQNTNEYVERLREISMEREERNTRVGSENVVVRDRGDHHIPTSLREYPSVRGLRDRNTGGGSVVLGNDMMDLIRGGSGGGSDSGGEGSGFELGGGNGMYCKWSHTTSTLTPMHLRKAKLMFFWTRYPSSAVIKMYFPDIKFNKNNTAQLVKWFSNFREFYYIQMEKYARQALSEGVKSSEDIIVTTDSELYRVLNLHYNRNNHIEVPSNFRFVVEQTLREFFKSIQAGKDSEQSWKKAIYKIIARLDDPVPEYFKSPNFLEQLE